MPPNVLLLVVDTLRADVVFGDHEATPGLDRLAAEGVSFRQCICTSTATAPSLASILTGCYPPTHELRGVQRTKLSTSLTTLAEAFGASGYHTSAEVTDPLIPASGILRGFREHRLLEANTAAPPNWREELVDRVGAKPGPWLHLLQVPALHSAPRPPSESKLPTDTIDQWLMPVFEAAGDDAIIAVTGSHGADHHDSGLQWQLVRAARRFGRVAHIEMWSRTLDRKLGNVGGLALYEHLIRVPLIMYGPGIAPAVVEDQVRHIDLLPTLAQMCDVSVPTGIDGRSLKPLLEGETLPDEPVYVEAVANDMGDDRAIGARLPDWKLVRHPPGKTALYKLDGGLTEPDEKHNLNRKYPEVARRLEAYIEEVDKPRRPTPSSSQ